MIGEGEKKDYVLINDFKIFIYDHILHLGKKYFRPYCSQTFITEEKLKRLFKVCFKIIGKQTIKMMIDILLCKNEANSVLK